MAGERFLGRWSRLKRDADGAGKLPAQPVSSPPAVAGLPVQPAAVAPAGPDAAALDWAATNGVTNGVRSGPDVLQARERVELPSIDSLGKDSDFSMFMRADVDPGLRVSALKKLFTDPHFNQMDGLDIYIDDYTKPDPMPLAMLKRLNQSRMVGLMEGEPEDASPTDRAGAGAELAAAVPPPPAGEAPAGEAPAGEGPPREGPVTEASRMDQAEALDAGLDDQRGEPEPGSVTVETPAATTAETAHRNSGAEASADATSAAGSPALQQPA
ncbi:MAG: DUF3306 domain-containing protein [Lautropia sp.]|nr:DUF3306 domain-containing protein [Lautropia sp.]